MSMNFDNDTESDKDSDTELIFSNISKLEPYCFEPKKQNLTQRIHDKDWCRCGDCRAKEASNESICFQDQKEVPEEYLEGNANFFDKTQQTEGIEIIHYNVALRL